MGNALSQSFRIPKPTLTEETLPDQSGKVFIVTGGYGGCGFELAKMLYGANGTVYVAGRSADKGAKALEALREAHPQSSGKIEFMQVDLSDLKTIKPAVEAFLGKESRLDVLTNNAGVMMPPVGSKDNHGNELQTGTNVVGPFLLTKLLHPVLIKTAAASEPGSVRVTWAGSLAVDMMSPKPGGVAIDASGAPSVHNSTEKDYGQSKAANVWLARETATRLGSSGLVSVAWNPGNLKSDLQRHMPSLQAKVISLGLHPPKMGAYTELFAGLDKSITPEKNGAYIIPWGREGTFRADITTAIENGKAAKLWEWCDVQTKNFA